ncbi:lipid-A-disaccharide synthase-related protein [Chamaesiphon sp. GL140_3_metabinner_50]|uniref:lipid-A-disaccharide synthase-related protein n=1 Tax=Chamaesiphon sp. GL140_3_metabinner_50 TaxID=2970812 RepID=UPI0025D34286|nr:lipid-A-disaccharide synthase-related protein [Chamaesiphon sp. GL140_3_metabinner_50]
MNSSDLQQPTKKVLFISNGHGEDLNAIQIVKALRQQQPQLEIGAMPIVGYGNAYRNLNINIIGPTEALPSGGFVYNDRFKLLEDIRSGLFTLLWRQIQAIRKYGDDCEAIFAVGDVVVLLGAYLTGKPYISFMVSSSAYYENKMQYPKLTEWLLKSGRCQQIFTRDRYTAELLNQQGYDKAIFVGFPAMDALEITGKDLQLSPVPLVALLPGSRLPEAGNNLQLLLDLAIATTPLFPDGIQFCAAVTPNLCVPDATGTIPLQQVAAASGWEYHATGDLTHSEHQLKLRCIYDAFADILHQCDLVAGMAGTAIEQAVGLGKPIIQIPGAGPQFTYTFAEAQMRLLGSSIQTIGNKPATAETISQAAQAIQRTLGDKEYLQQCRENGLERIGGAGGGDAMARIFADRFLKTD